MEHRKTYTFDQVTEIGRKEFNLPDNWFCFMGKVEGDRLRYGLSPVDKNGRYMDEEVYGYLPLV